MGRYYDSFRKLKESVADTYGNMAMLLEKFDWSFFSEDGQNKIEAYAILDDAFNLADDKKELVQIVAGEVRKLEKKVEESRNAGSDKDADDSNAVLKLLVKYIRHNLDEEFWDEYSEFNIKHYHVGC